MSAAGDVTCRAGQSWRTLVGLENVASVPVIAGNGTSLAVASSPRLIVAVLDLDSGSVTWNGTLPGEKGKRLISPAK